MAGKRQTGNVKMLNIKETFIKHNTKCRTQTVKACHVGQRNECVECQGHKK